MKKNYILLIVIGIILTTSLLIVLVSKNNPKKFMQDGVMFAVKVDGVPQDHFPNDGNKYYVDIECENARGQWKRMPDSSGNNEDFRISIDNITGKVECSVDFQTIDLNNNNEEYLLNNIVEEKAIKEEFSIPNYSSVTNITTSLINPTQFHYSNSTGISGTPLSVWSLNEDDEYESDPSLMTYNGGRYYHLYAQIPEEGNYQVCYTIEPVSTSSYNGLYIAINNTQKAYSYATTSLIASRCFELGQLSTSDYINISARKYNASATVPVMKFRLEKSNENVNYDAGYRYEGTNPNNYIWFNNEKWRIIGLIPTCTSSGCATSQNLIKIIRKDSIGSFAYDAKASNYTGEWGNNTLYTLLNAYYWGKQDGTNTAYCYRRLNTVKGKCDYTVIGLSESDFYGSMVENVYWNTGASVYNATANQSYANETQRQTLQGRVGIMNASDYGYGYYSTNRSVSLSTIQSLLLNQENWLYSSSYQWTCTQYSAPESVFNVSYTGGIDGTTNSQASLSNLVRPVVYLSPNVYVVGGNGTEATPYQIAKYTSS